MRNDTTTQEDVEGDHLAPRLAPSVLALVVAWCSHEPFRVGEVAIVPPSFHDDPRVLGRGSASDGDPRPRLDFVRHRPGQVKLSPALSINSISRTQLVVRAVEDGVIEVQNVGRAELRHNGTTTTTCRVEPGHTIQIGRQLLLLCVSRPAWLSTNAESRFEHAFGMPDVHGIVGESASIWALREALDFAAKHANHVLIHGATGTGKELVARAIHARSHSQGRFVSRNAATIPSTLLDAELFGNLKNYPNPGMADRPGLIGEADGGTLFLDEFAELGSAGEAHLLRVLDAGEYQRLGESRHRKSTFRLVAATNRHPSELKVDLLARLALRLETPDLNQRRDDVPLIARHLMRHMAEQDGSIAARYFPAGDPTREPKIAVDCMHALVVHDYSANVRELEALLLEAMRNSPRDELLAPPAIAPRGRSYAPNDVLIPSPMPLCEDVSVPSQLSLCEPDPRQHFGGGPTPYEVQACLDQNNGAIERTWRALGLPSRHVLRRLIQKYRLEVRRHPRRV